MQNQLPFFIFETTINYKEEEKEGVEKALEKSKIDLSLKEDKHVNAMVQEDPLASEASYSKKIKPRALIFKAHNKDLNKIKELIETQFPEVEIIYVTTGPSACTLRVTKSMPFEKQDSFTQPFYTIE